MTHRNPDPPYKASTQGSGLPGALTLIVLVESEQRLEQLRGLVGRLAPGSRIVLADGPMDVTQRLSRAVVDLLVVDHAVSAFAVPALVRHLARSSPSLPVLAFDDAADPATVQTSGVWHWNEAEVALQHAIDRCGPPRTLAN